MKVGRQAKIIELIRTHDVETQEELGDLLQAAGYRVTQATISRDIRELRLTKVPTAQGQKYVVLQENESSLRGKFVNVLREGVVHMEVAENLLVVKTVPGMAMAVAAAIDQLEIAGVAGCVGGDDTILCAIRTRDEAGGVLRELQAIQKG